MENSQIHTPIIPIEQIFYNTDTGTIVPWGNHHQDLDIDYKAIAVFCALGFMLDDQTFYKQIKTLKPATKYELKNNVIVEKGQYWQWHHNPIDCNLSKILDEFTTLFEKFIKDETNNKSILLPISGGVDSRTLFVSVKGRSDLTLSSYEFENGFHESETSIKLSHQFNIPLYSNKIQRGYLWNKLDDLHKLNQCFTDFTHPRQMAVMHEWKELGDTILLGHWGDVLFDQQVDSDTILYDEQLIQLKKKILTPGGCELAKDLWKFWGIEGSFDSYITDRLDKLYRGIDIEHPSARTRAFKSLYWAPRWTSINLSIFRSVAELVLPYYNDKMCKFICTIPERYLTGRKIQIEYIKKNCPEAAKIPWQKYYPLNLYQYKLFNCPVYYPVRAFNKVKRILYRELFKIPKLITRNWELQFLGENNFLQLKKNLMKYNELDTIIPKAIIENYLKKFQINPVKYAHPLSILLTLTVFSDRYNQK